jgi:hypothetical protein
MTNRENNKILTCFAILIFTFMLINTTNAQTTAKVTDDLVIKLQHKVLLTDKQVDEIKLSLIDYLNNPSEENKKNLSAKIELSLDEKQKVKYDIIKNDWWESVKKELAKIKKLE